MSSRSEPSGEETVSLSARVLDAAAELVARHGIRKTGIDDIARLAGCARPTVYKHYASKEALLGALLLRETGSYLDAIEEMQRNRPITSKLIEDTFVFTLRYIAEHPVAQGLIAAEPEALLPLLRGAGGDFIGTIGLSVAALVKRQIAAGAIRKIDPRIVAELFIRFMASFVLVPRVLLDREDEAAMRRLFRQGILQGIAGDTR